jgi:hypothetical protein
MISATIKSTSARGLYRGPATLFSIAVTVLAVVITAAAQTPTPTPNERYTIKGSAEIGARWAEVEGSENKFRSDLNYKRGFRVFDSGFTIEDTSTNEGKPFDSLTVLASGWGADPTGYFRAGMERTGYYRFDANVRRVTYFNNLNNHAIGNDRRSLSTADRRRNFGDLDLTLLPQNPNIRFRIGYSFNVADGSGTTAMRISRGDVFPAVQDLNYKAGDFRVGADGKLLGFNLSGTYGYRSFTDRTLYSITNDPGDVTTNTIRIESMNRSNPIVGDTHFGVFSLQRTFAKVFDVAAKVVHNSVSNDFIFDETVVFRNATNVQVRDIYSSVGDAKRLQTRADLGFTWRIADKFRLSNTFNFDGFNLNGGNVYQNIATPGTTTRQLNYTSTRYRRYTNTLEGDFQVNNRFGFNIGWRYTHREVALGISTVNFGSSIPPLVPEEAENTTNTFIAGTKFKPTSNWTVFADVEAGKADNVFTRLANYEFANFRVRSRTNFNKFAVNLSFITKDNDNPGQSVTAPTASFVTQVRSRIFSSSIDWDPISEVSISGGYDYHWLTSEVSVLIPLGGPATAGLSQYFVRDNYFFIDGRFRPHNRVSLFGSFRWNKDNGANGMAIPPIASPLILSSYPIDFKMPEVRGTFRLSRYVDWSVGYQYFDYSELTPQQVQYGIAPQNYNAHLPYVSLRIYLGRAAMDR